jgi:hypothetical protein
LPGLDAESDEDSPSVQNIPCDAESDQHSPSTQNIPPSDARESDEHSPSAQNIPLDAPESSEGIAVTTFGTPLAAPSTGAPSTSHKQINRNTTNDYSNVPSGGVFFCPVP